MSYFNDSLYIASSIIYIYKFTYIRMSYFYVSHYFIYDSQCIVYSVIYLVT